MRRWGAGRRDHLQGAAVALDDFELVTERLRLRPFAQDDLDVLASIFADPVMMEWYPAPFSRAESQLWIERNQRRYREKGFGLWALELRDDSTLIGDCGLIDQTVDGVDEVEVGWHVARERWGHGFAPEAARAVVDHAFSTLGLSSLISLIRPENVNSRRVAEKLGMRIEKETGHGGPAYRHFVYRLERSSR